MRYCLNPACDRPQNPDNHSYCHGCGEALATSTEGYLFRVHYRITKCLGEGAFGRTYLAEDTDLMGEPRVIKKLIASAAGSMQAKIQELFLREAKQLYNLKHPQIPKLYAYFEQNNALYLIQEFIEGEDLFKEFCQQGIFSEEKIKALLQDILPVLDYLHSNRVLHRDIKPDNIMRCRETGQLILIDFGGAKQTSTTLQSQPGTSIYTPGYAAIEHIMGQPCVASDIYSLGATCARLLTGCFPLSDEFGNIQDELYDKGSLRWQWREYLQKQGKTINKELGNILDKMLAMIANDRYQSAQEILSILNPKPPVIRQTIIPPPPPPAKTPPVSQPTLISSPSQAKIQPPPPPSPSPSPAKTPPISQPNLISSPAVRRGEAEYFTVNLGNDVALEMVAIPGGKFLMGSPATEKGHRDNESPQHEVTIPPFYMGKYQVTQAQWQAVMSNNLSGFKGANNPVEKVSWNNCVVFCKKLSEKTGLTFRLLSEAEWEYSCRSVNSEGLTVGEGNQKYNQPFHFGATLTSKLANYNATYTYAEEPKREYREKTTPVGSFLPNAFGLYDMHGNVWEWCEDDYHSNYEGAPTDGSAWIDNDNRSQSKNNTRILRGGSWSDNPHYCRSAYRTFNNPDDDNYDNIGFRVAVSRPRTS